MNRVEIENKKPQRRNKEGKKEENNEWRSNGDRTKKE